ncbi:hypothetical protein [Achromobacter sp. NFACC18-2]|uniref:hypothetical protein n=1 Tax=Achromobacter sp. NFACC18-2 TaxID=1564112 RepID=UPI001113B073|nr:hypothetical protein [Achromobacter sp. NFACC18-2]
MSPLAVTCRPTISPPRVEVIWEAPSQNLCCTIEYPEKAPVGQESSALRDFVNAKWPLPRPRRMIVGGEFSMVLDSEGRLHDFDIRTDLIQRFLHPIAPGDADYVEPYIQASFDEGGDAECCPIEEALYDPAQGIVCLSWGAADRWCNIAPTLALGLAADGKLMKIQLSEFWPRVPEARS